MEPLFVCIKWERKLGVFTVSWPTLSKNPGLKLFSTFFKNYLQNKTKTGDLTSKVQSGNQ